MIATRDIYWLAGFIEGEGHVRFAHQNNCITIGACSKDKDVIDKASSLLDTKTFGPYRNKTCEMYEFRLYGIRAASWIMTLYSLMGERRREQMKKALHLWKTVPIRNKQGLTKILSPTESAARSLSVTAADLKEAISRVLHS